MSGSHMELSEIGVICLILLIILAIVQGLRLLWLIYTPTGEPRPRPTEIDLPKVPQTNVPTGRAARTTSALKRMVIMSGLKRDEHQLPSESQFAIGRFQNLDNGILIALDDRSISRRHALFEADDTAGEYYLRDTNSSFGTFLQLNGNFEKIQPDKRERIYNEDVIRFGSNVVVRFILPGDTRASSTQL